MSGATLVDLNAFNSGLLIFLVIHFCANCLAATRFNITSVVARAYGLLLPVVSLKVAGNIFHFTVSSDRSGGDMFSSNLCYVALNKLVFLIVAPLLSLFSRFGNCL